MKHEVLSRSSAVVASASLGAIAFAYSSSAQAVPSIGSRPSPERAVDDVSLAPSVFEGRVIRPDGTPASGAVVVSCAGGRAVADAHGRFRLAAVVPIDAATVRITAVAAGHALYAGGRFDFAGGVATSQIAKWDGSDWTPLGSGVGAHCVVNALAVFDDGSGPALYAGGSFAIELGTGAPGDFIARRDGSSWSGVDGGMNGTVLALAVFDDGSGPALHVGGAFTTAGGEAANHVAKWPRRSGGPWRHARLGPLPALNDWAPLGSGVSGTVRDMAVFDAGDGPALYAGGLFGSVLDSSDSYLGKWACQQP